MHNSVSLTYAQQKSRRFLNKRPMGHIAYLKNQFKSMNTFEQSYENVFIKLAQ